jgi:hypothetical protein
MKRWAAVVGLAVLACGRSPGPQVSTTISSDPASVSAGLVGHLAAARYSEAAELTLLEQMPLIAMAEGATIDEAALIIGQGSEQVAARYWEGFSEAVGAEALPRQLGESTAIEQDGEMFAVVELVEGAPSRLVLRMAPDEWQVDLLATFGASLAVRLEDAVVTMRGDNSSEALQLLDLAKEQRPSLQVAAADPALTATLEEPLTRLLAVLARSR